MTSAELLTATLAATIQTSPRLSQLAEHLRQLAPCLIAYSGGVDSSLLAMVAHAAIPEQYLAVTVDFPAFPRSLLAQTCSQAARYGLRHRCLPMVQLDIPEFAANDPRRCYYCKKVLLGLLQKEGEGFGASSLLDGSNADDTQDFRPGTQALQEAGVESPLLDLNWHKDEIRAAARLLGLPSADLPSYACLASRIPTHAPVTAEKLQQIERFEDLLHELGFLNIRARHHGDTLRLEAAAADLPRLVCDEVRGRLLPLSQKLGFRWLTVDLEPYRTGRLNP